MVSFRPLRIGLWDPFQMAFFWLINGGDPNHLQVLGWSSKYKDDKIYKMLLRNQTPKPIPTALSNFVNGILTSPSGENQAEKTQKPKRLQI